MEPQGLFLAPADPCMVLNNPNDRVCRGVVRASWMPMMRYVNICFVASALAIGVVACNPGKVDGTSGAAPVAPPPPPPIPAAKLPGVPSALPEDKCPPFKPGDPTTTHPNGERYSAGFLEWFDYFTVDAPAIGGSPPMCPPGGKCNIAGKLKKAHGGECPSEGGVRTGTLKVVENDPCLSGDTKVPVYEASILDWQNHPVDPCGGQVYEPTADESSSCDAQKLEKLQGKVIAIPGYWDESTGAFHDKAEGESKQVYTLACMTGAAAKCAHWGYPPWSTKDGKPLAPYHRACVEAVRAHFCTGRADGFTCSGTNVDVFDRLGVQKRTSTGSHIESVWGPGGLVCLTKEHARWPMCDLQISACAHPDACPDTINDAYWASHPDALLAVATNGGNHPVGCDGADCCVSNPKHCR